ncbi:MAG: alanine:cation symporter family protein [Clostridioides sp.]|jgi:AGCS family alanine or glycine:cation symporter|nr:alanine:cation symporter family protein [Clostridioides sp.]
MDAMNNVVLQINDVLWSYVIIIMLIAAGIYFTIRTKFVQFTSFGEQFRLLGSGIGDKEAKKDGKISSFQAFCISTASRVGTGNIAGIALAIAVGGPGSIFWMWLIALIGSASSFVESTLAQMYKVKNGSAFRGGPAYYMEQGLKSRKMGIAFAILISMCFGFVFNAVQTNTITLALNNSFGFNRSIMAVAVAVLTALIIFGGAHRIAKAAEIMVPVLAGLYIIIAIIVVLMNITHIPAVFGAIFSNALNIKSATGGFMGGAMMMGIKRGLFSNEAGMGSAPNAAATAHVNHPVVQGLIQSLGVFTDTIIICSCTAFMILLFPGYSTSPNTGIELAQEAIVSHIGNVGGIFIAVSIFLFAFSSIIGNYYYSEANIEFITPKKGALNVFRALVCGMVIFGGITSVDIVWNLADLFMALMAILNIIAILILGKFAFKALEDYKNQKNSGIKEPVFKSSSIEGLEVSEWK